MFGPEGTVSKYNFDFKWILIGIIVLYLLVFQVFPLLFLTYRAFFNEGYFSLDGFRRVYSHPLNWIAIRNTLVTSSLATVFGVLISFPLAFLVGRTNMIGKKFFRIVFVMTYMVPPYLGAMAWMRLLNPRVGTLNVFLQNLLGLEAAPFNIYTVIGVTWVITTFYYPFAFITISRAMEKMDPSLEEAARISGSSPLRTLRTVTLPLMAPSIVAAALLVFVAAASCFGIPAIVGIPGRVHTVTTRILDLVFVGNIQGLDDGATLAVFLMVISVFVLYISTFVIGKRQYITVSGKSTRPNIVDLGKWRWPIFIFICALTFIIVFLPFITVGLTSITVNLGRDLSLDNITFRYWERIFTRRAIVSSTRNSIIAATTAATAGIGISITMAYLLMRTTTKGRRIPDFLITVGGGMPSVVIALGLIMSMSGRFTINIYNTLYIIIVAYMIKYTLMGMRTVVSSMSQIHPSLEEASQISGASWLRTTKNILIPLIAPSVVAGWFLIFMPSFYELSMSTLLQAPLSRTIGYELYTYQTYHSQQTASALATAILLLVIAVNAILYKITKGEFSI